jgi:transposase
VRAVALDVHRDFCEVAIVADGRLRSAGRIQTRPDALGLFAQSLDPRDWVALEVTGNAWEIARILERHVARVIVVSPTDTGIRQARAKTETHAVLMRCLKDRPPASDLFGVRGRRWLAGQQLPVCERETVDSAMRQVAFLDSEIGEVEKLIAAEALGWPEVKRLMTVSSTAACSGSA